MKFTLPLSKFQNALMKALPAVPPKSTLPELEHLHFALEEQTLRIVGSDQEVTILTKVDVNPGDEIETGTILAPGKRISEIAKALGGKGDVAFESDPETFEIKLKTQKGVYGMKGMNPENYLDIPDLFGEDTPEVKGDESEIDKNLSAKIAKEDIVRMANKTLFAVSKEETLRPAMTGVFLQFKPTHANMVATDSYRLSRAKTAAENEDFPEDFEIILPSRMVDLLKRADSEAIISPIIVNGRITRARFDVGNTTYVSRLIEEKFPPYESVIPDTCEFEATIDRKELLSAIKRVSIFSSVISKQIRLHFMKNNVALAADDDETGSSAKETLNCDYPGEEIEIGFNYKYLEEALQNLEDDDNENDQVKMFFSEPNKPALVKPLENVKDQLMLIMPVRISER